MRERSCERGLEGTVKRKSPDREYDRKLDGEKEAELIRLACSEAPEGRSEWSLRLLSDKMVEMGVVDSLSHEIVRRTPKKPAETTSERAVGHPPGAKCAIRSEDGGCTLCLPVPLRPGLPGDLHGRDVPPTARGTSGSRRKRSRARLVAWVTTTSGMARSTCLRFSSLWRTIA
ncbi:helix-turn-helix domain-containing protein [Salinibacter ruber]|uniref:helix-turn-helix domain-containing protein n=1 Tax=Salinibacter ruber TaxID=146919 RepID=UPI003C6E5DB5